MQTEEVVRLNGIYKRLLANAGVKLFEGEGRVIGPNEVEVIQLDGTKISYSAKHILIATGGRAQRPDIPGQVFDCRSRYFIAFLYLDLYLIFIFYMHRLMLVLYIMLAFDPYKLLFNS